MFAVTIPAAAASGSASISVSEFFGGGPGEGEGGGTNIYYPETTPVVLTLGEAKDVSGDLLTIDGSTNKVAYVQFTPDADGDYTLSVEAAITQEVGPFSAPVVYLPGTMNASSASSGEDGTTWSSGVTYSLAAGTTYAFQVMVPAGCFAENTAVNVTISQGSIGGGESDGTIIFFPETTPVDLKLEETANVKENLLQIVGSSDQVVYVAFTPTETDRYSLCVEAAIATSVGPRSNPVMYLPEVLLGSGSSGESNDVWSTNVVYDLVAGTTYAFQITVPAGCLADGAEVNVTMIQGEVEIGGPPNLYPVPEPGWPEAGSEAEQQIIEPELDEEQLLIINDNLVSLSDDWYVGYVEVTPDVTGIYQINVEIPGGYIVDAEDQPMPQTFRIEPMAQWSNGGCAFEFSGDIHLADYYRLIAGTTYKIKLLLCKHGIDYTKNVYLKMYESDCPLRTDDIFADGRRVTATVKGFFNSGSDDTVSSVGSNVVIDATVADAQGVEAVSVSLEAVSTATLAEAQVSKATIETNVADVSFDASAISKMAATQESVVLDVSKTETSDSLTVSLDMVSFGNEVLPESTSAENGLVTVSVPYELQNGYEAVVEYVRPDGTTTSVEARYDEASDSVVFSTNHFSDYKITQKKKPATVVTHAINAIKPIAKQAIRHTVKQVSKLLKWALQLFR